MKCRSLIVFLATACFAAAAQQPSQGSSPDKSQPPAANKAAAEKAPPKKVVADLSGFELDPRKNKSQGLQIGAGSRGATIPPALYAPSLGKAYGLQPVFFWGESTSAQKFTFRLYDSNDDEIYEQDVDGKVHSFTYPSDAPALKSGATYSWTVQAIAAQLVEPPEPVRITLVAGAERQSIDSALQNAKSDSLADRMQRSQIFVDHRLWYDAIAIYTQLIADNRNNPELYKQRAQIYAQLPETQRLANQDMEQAGKLQVAVH